MLKFPFKKLKVVEQRYKLHTHKVLSRTIKKNYSKNRLHNYKF